MSNKLKPEDIDVVILCGGKGERLQSLVNERPKPMAEINGHPFLDILLDYMASFGFRRFILCICHKGEFIRRYYKKGDVSFAVLFSEEKEPLGTAGAIKKAELLIKSNPFLVTNGDSICKLDLKEFINFYIKKKALFSMVLSDMQNTDDYGKVVLDKSERIIGFSEKVKSNSANNFASAGIYLLDKSILCEIPENKKCSIEYDIFPRIVNKRSYGFVTYKKFIDIGTSERFKWAQIHFRRK